MLWLGSLVRQSKGYIQQWEGLQIKFLGTVGETALMLVKLFVDLTYADLHPKFPDQAEPLALLCKLLALPTHLLAQGLLDHTFSRSCLQPFWSDRAGRYSTADGAVI